MPVYERLGEVREAAMSGWWIGFLLLKRGRADDRAEAEAMLCSAPAMLRRMKLPEAGQIEAIIGQAGLRDG